LYTMHAKCPDYFHGLPLTNVYQNDVSAMTAPLVSRKRTQPVRLAMGDALHL
jgi:hypothetical protein